MSEMELELELQILPNFPIVGRTVQEIQKEYSIHVLQLRKHGLNNCDKFNPPLNMKIEVGWYIRVSGPYEKVSLFGKQISNV